MPGPLPGKPEDYKQDEDGRWYLDGHPEYGLITLNPLVYPTFEDYYNHRASEPDDPVPEQLPSPVEAALIEELAVTKAALQDLAMRLEKLEGKPGA